MGGNPFSGYFPNLSIPISKANAPTNAAEFRKQTEDKVSSLVDGLSELEQAVLYQYLNAQGMNLHKSQELRRKAGW